MKKERQTSVIHLRHTHREASLALALLRGIHPSVAEGRRSMYAVPDVVACGVLKVDSLAAKICLGGVVD